MEVTVILRNTSKVPVHLNFPTGQTIEIVLREPNNGKVLTKWSTDRVFNSEGRYLLINPQERLEFNEPITHARPANRQALHAGNVLRRLREGPARDQGHHPAVLTGRNRLSADSPCGCSAITTCIRRGTGCSRTPGPAATLGRRGPRKGLTDIAFTDHDRYHEGVDFDAIDALRAANPDLRIRAGIELDNDPVTGAAGREWVERHWDRLDFVLGSVHYLEADKMFDSVGQEGQFEGPRHRRDLRGLFPAGARDGGQRAWWIVSRIST